MRPCGASLLLLAAGLDPAGPRAARRAWEPGGLAQHREAAASGLPDVRVAVLYGTVATLHPYFRAMRERERARAY